MATLLPNLFADVGNGIQPSDGAKLHFNNPGVETDKDTYTTSAASTPNANPVIADSTGKFPDIYIIGSYDWILTDKNDVQIRTGSVSEYQTTDGSDFVKNFDTLALAIAESTLVDGDLVYLEERSTGNGGGAFWKAVLLSSVTPSTGEPAIGNIVTCTGVPTLALVLDTSNPILNTAQWGLSTSNTASDNSAVMQLCIDFQHARWISGTPTTGGGGGWVDSEAGAFDVVGWIDKNGAPISGKGSTLTHFLLVGDNVTGMSNASATTQLAADGVSFSEKKGFTFRPKDPSSLTPTGQIIWNIQGYSRWTTTDVVIGWCGGVTGISLSGATPASSGGPANWHNDFYSCFFLRPSSSPTGGVAVQIGDATGTFEQATTWNFYGGRTSGANSGTGLNINHATSINYHGHVFESCDVNIGSGAGTNIARHIQFYPLYIEGSAGENFTLHTNAEDTGIFGFFGTGMVFNNTGTRTQLHGPGLTQMFAGNSGSQKWEVEMQGSNTRAPKFVSLSGTAEIELVDASANTVSIINGTITSGAERSFEVRDNAEANLIRCGSASAMIAGADLYLNNDSGFGIFSGTGSPEGAQIAGVGSLFIRTDGGASTSLYVKESGTSNTGWAAK